jgi:hypothetical protein
MKNLQSILIAFTLIIATSISCFSQSARLEKYINNGGAKAIGLLAHPTSTYHSATYNMKSNGAIVTVKYTDGVKTSTRIYEDSGIIYDIDLLFDTDWWPPYEAMAFLKEVISEMIQEDFRTSEKVITDFEKYLGKSFQSFTGQEFSTIFLAIDFISS